MKKIILFYSLLLLIIHCTNPFNNRDINPPKQTSPTQTSNIYPLSYDSVLVYLRYAMEEQDRDRYMACFIDPQVTSNSRYKFIPDYRLAYEVFQDWDLQKESSYINTVFLKEEEQKIQMSYSEIEYTTDWHDSVLTAPFEYKLIIQYNNDRDIYAGKAIMKFSENSNEQWGIYYWEDIPITDSTSWSQLKLENRY